MSHQDDAFFATFKGIMIFLVVFAVVIYIAAKLLTGGFYEEAGPGGGAQEQSVEENIKPVGEVDVTEKPGTQKAGAQAPAVAQESPAPGKAPPGEAPGAAPSGDEGKKIYTSACFACHGTGAANAPKLGDKGAWASRIDKGVQTLYDHAINGFQGSAGVMPAKGGRGDLSDAEVKAAVDYLVAESQ